MSNRDRVPRTLKQAFGPYARSYDLTPIERPRSSTNLLIFSLVLFALLSLASVFVFAEDTTPKKWHWKTLASHYGKGDGFHGRRTANGETHNMNAMTAAHKHLPFGTMLLVENSRTGKAVIVRINDRGPFIQGRDLDLSSGAAEKIGCFGVCPVRIAQL